jgi:hypothetical protein
MTVTPLFNVGDNTHGIMFLVYTKFTKNSGESPVPHPRPLSMWRGVTESA